jgi:hypothetical protein
MPTRVAGKGIKAGHGRAWFCVGQAGLPRRERLVDSRPNANRSGNDVPLAGASKPGPTLEQRQT